MEALSLVISILTLGFSLFVYLAHDKKLNAQQEQLNEIALKNAKQEEENNKRAVISLRYVKKDNQHKLIIANTGKASARNLEISTKVNKNDPLSRCNPKPFWEELKSGQSIEQDVIITNHTDDIVHYNITWIDDFGEQFDTQIVYY